MPSTLGPTELIIILAIIMILFGVGRVARIGREMGSAVSEFRKGMKETEDEEPGQPETVEG
jgi:sec-independent protein translocase protein TatA